MEVLRCCCGLQQRASSVCTVRASALARVHSNRALRRLQGRPKFLRKFDEVKAEHPVARPLQYVRQNKAPATACARTTAAVALLEMPSVVLSLPVFGGFPS